MIKITTKSTNTSLSLQIIKGSPKQRNKMASRISRQFYTKLLSVSNSNSCSIKDFCENLNKLLHNKINFGIFKQENPKYKGSIKHNITGTTCNSNGIISLLIDGYKIFLPLDKNGQNITNKFTAIHEARHLFDHVFNPKTNQYRLQNLYGKIDFESKKDYLSDMFLDKLDNPVNMKKFEKSVRELTETMPDDITIDALQTIRNRLKSEINAYGDEMRSMAKGLGLFYNLPEIIITKIFLNDNAKFKQKLKFANALLKEKLESARSTHRQSLNF